MEERDRLREELATPNIRVGVCVAQHKHRGRSMSLTGLEVNSLPPVPSEATPQSKDAFNLDNREESKTTLPGMAQVSSLRASAKRAAQKAKREWTGSVAAADCGADAQP